MPADAHARAGWPGPKCRAEQGSPDCACVLVALSCRCAAVLRFAACLLLFAPQAVSHWPWVLPVLLLLLPLASREDVACRTSLLGVSSAMRGSVSTVGGWRTTITMTMTAMALQYNIVMMNACRARVAHSLPHWAKLENRTALARWWCAPARSPRGPIVHAACSRTVKLQAAAPERRCVK